MRTLGHNVNFASQSPRTEAQETVSATTASQSAATPSAPPAPLDPEQLSNLLVCFSMFMSSIIKLNFIQIYRTSPTSHECSWATQHLHKIYHWLHSYKTSLIINILKERACLLIWY